MSDSDGRKSIHTELAPDPIGPYVQAISWNRLIFTSGQIGMRGDGTMPEGIVEQTERVIENLKGVLEAGGASLASVLKTTIYLKEMSDFATVNEVYARFFGDHPPARSTIQAAALPKGAAVEIEAVAIVTS